MANLAAQNLGRGSNGLTKSLYISPSFGALLTYGCVNIADLRLELLSNLLKLDDTLVKRSLETKASFESDRSGSTATPYPGQAGDLRVLA